MEKGSFLMENKMFCYQCQETAGCKGCTQVGVCGKTAETARLQDLLIYATKGLSAGLVDSKYFTSVILLIIVSSMTVPVMLKHSFSEKTQVQ